MRLALDPVRRGRVTFTATSVARRDPLGLVRALRRQPAPDTLLVLPRRYPLPAVALPGARRYQPGGIALASSVGDSEEFVSLRDYRPGDPLKRIHWRSWARTGKPVVREYQDEFFVRHALVLDTFARTDQGERLEAAVSVAASLACAFETGEALLDPDVAGKRHPNFLRDELEGRLRLGPVAFRLLLQLAKEGDPTDDVTALWPEGRPLVEMGRLEITGLSSTSAADERRLIFDPTNRTDGIDLSDDPILLARSAAYAISYDRRSKGE